MIRCPAVEQGLRTSNRLRVHGRRPRKTLMPSTPQMRKRQQQARCVTVRRGGRIRLSKLPPGWKVGQRVFWKVNCHREAIGTLSPNGTLHRGRYFSSRLRR